MGRGHQGRQDVCLLSETNSVSDERLGAGTTHAESSETAEAWGLDSNQQCIDEETGEYIQFISSLSYQPVQIYRNTTVRNTDASVISAQTEDQEMTFTQRGGRGKDSRLLWVGICLALLTLTLCIAALIRIQG